MLGVKRYTLGSSLEHSSLEKSVVFTGAIFIAITHRIITQHVYLIFSGFLFTTAKVVYNCNDLLSI